MNTALKSDHSEDSFGFVVADGSDAIDRSGVAEVSMRLFHGYGVTLPQVVENAGRALAILASRRYFGGDARGSSVVVLVGEGNCGASALTASRRLAIWGTSVRLVAARSSRPALGLSSRQMAVLATLGITPQELPDTKPALIIDALVGFEPDVVPSGRSAQLIDWANRSGAPVLSLESPAGVCTRRKCPDFRTMRADATLMLGMPKQGLIEPARAAETGALYLADISIPPQLWRNLKRPLVAPDFALGDILRILRRGESVADLR